jgi:predicted O-methyltransferase YrrM
VIEGLFREGTAVARLNGTVHRLFPVGISAAEGEALRDWVVREAASHTIEVGLAYGISALFICEALITNGAPDATHSVLDPNQEIRFSNCGLQFLEEAGASQLIEFLPTASEFALPRLLADGRHFDLAFVDGNHRFDGVFLDLIYLGRLVRPGGIIVVDDYQLRSVARAVAFCANNLGWTVEELSRHQTLHQWAVLRTAEEPAERSFDHYVDF